MIFLVNKMKTKNTLLIITAYFLMILIWSTTPLAIKWSSQGIDFISGLSLRMLLGAVLAFSLAILWYKQVPLHRAARRVYMASALAIYGAMMLVYWGAQFIPSGLISVLYGLTPIFTGVFALFLLNNEAVGFNKIFGALLGILGLAVIFSEQLSFGEQAVLGILATLFSVILHSASAVWIKRLNTPMPALVVTAGGLIFSVPLFIVTFMVFAEPLPNDLPARTLWAILYLGVMGSVVGFVSYYFVLAKLSPSTVALATLVTPVTALLLGKWFNQESISVMVFLGTGLVITGLIIHQFYGLIVQKLFSRA